MEIKHNITEQQFEYKQGDALAKLEYRFKDDCIAFTHTEVPDRLKGRGIASALAKNAFQFAEELNKTVLVYCSFISVYVKKHPELKEQLNKGFHH